MLHAYDPETEMVLIGRATPGSPAGDIWVSKALLAQEGGWRFVQEMIRRQYKAAYEAKERRDAIGRL